MIDHALESAVLKHLPNLRQACHRTVAASQCLRDAAMRNEFGCIASKVGARQIARWGVRVGERILEEDARI